MVAVFRTECVSRLRQINAYIPHAVVPVTKIPLIIVKGGQSIPTRNFNVYITVK